MKCVFLSLIIGIFLISCGRAKDEDVCYNDLGLERDPYCSFTHSGHRAQASSEFHENSLSALRYSLIIGPAPYLEFDVRTTKDNELVVFHDPDTGPITGYPADIKDTDYKDLPLLINGEMIPTLDEFIREICSHKYNKMVVIDVKNADYDLVRSKTSCLIKWRFFQPK
jgi:glycerophosphoryl diester phosphodiesterase